MACLCPAVIALSVIPVTPPQALLPTLAYMPAGLSNATLGEPQSQYHCRRHPSQLPRQLSSEQFLTLRHLAQCSQGHKLQVCP